MIKIPKEVKNRLCFGVTYAKDIQTVCEALHNGTPLPKGHGRLIDADELLRKHPEFDTYPFPSTTINNAPPIIGADRGR